MTQPINQQLLGQGSPLGYSIVDRFTFNGRSLDNGNTVRVIGSDHDDIGTIDFSTYNTPLEDGGGVLGKYYRVKNINIVLSINASNETEFNNLIDDVKYNTSKTEGILKIIINNTVRQWTATLTSLKFNRQSFNVNRCGNVVLTFACVNPHSYLINRDGETIESETGTFTRTFEYPGKAESYPILYLTIDSGTATGMTYTLNGYEISITESLTAGDVIEFNGESKQVLLNGTEIFYSGPFTPLTNGENTMTIDNDGTYSGTLSYYTKFL